MYLAGRWANRQLSRVELVIVVIILGFILTVFVQYMLKMFAIAERSMLSATITNINTAMQYRAAGYALRGDYTSLEAMQDMNPFSPASADPGLLIPEVETGLPLQQLAGVAYMQVPGNYLGELYNPDPADIEGLRWYYDLSDRTLVYRVDNAEYFDSNLPGPPRAEFLVRIDYKDHNTNNRYEPLIDEYQGIRLQALNEYGWHTNFTGGGD